MSVCILHDRFPQIGGGEHFVIEAARILDCPIFTMYVADGVEIPEDIEAIPIKQKKYTGLVSGKFLEWKNEGMNPLETLSVGLDMTDVDLRQFDVVLESAPLSKSYIPEVNQTVLHYPHSPPRWLYDLYRERLKGFDYPFIRMLVKGYADYHRFLDQSRNQYVDRFIANSELVRDRIKRYYNRESDVVYPPVTGDWRNGESEDYFITWSRLSPEKRTPMICEAFSKLDEKLVVAGKGKQEKKIKKWEKECPNIEYLGFVKNIEELVSHAKAVVYAPKQEDFGLVGAEALTAGKPLIGVNEGFTKEQVVDGVTGLRFEPTVESLQLAVKRFDEGDFASNEIQEFAKQYSRQEFEMRLNFVIDRETGKRLC